MAENDHLRRAEVLGAVERQLRDLIIATSSVPATGDYELLTRLIDAAQLAYARHQEA